MGKSICYPHQRFEKPAVEVSPEKWACPGREIPGIGHSFAPLVDAAEKAGQALMFERKVKVSFSGKAGEELKKCEGQPAQFEFWWQAFDNGRPRGVWHSGRVPMEADWTCIQRVRIDPDKVAFANSLYCAIVHKGAYSEALGLKRGAILWEEETRHSVMPGDEHFEKCLLDFSKNENLRDHAGQLVHIRMPDSLDEDAFNADHPLVIYVNTGHYLHGGQFEDKLTCELALTRLMEHAIDNVDALHSQYADPLETIPPEQRRMGHHLAQLCRQAGIWEQIRRLSSDGGVALCQDRIRTAAAGLLRKYDGVIQ